MWLIITIVLLVLILYLSVRPYGYWKKKGVPFIPPLPLVGNAGSYVFRRRAFCEMFLDAYLHFPDHRYFGFYQFIKPVLMIRDPDLIKTILVKDFDAFPQHTQFIPEDVDPIWAKNLFAVQGKQKWQNIRSTISPVFTSSKMKMMFPLIKQTVNQFVQFHSEQGDNTVVVEFKEAFTKLANDVITTTAFGIECDSLKNPDNIFYKSAYEVTDLRGLNMLRFLIGIMLPSVMKFLNIGIISKKISSFYHKVIQEAIKLREDQGIIRPDLIHLLIEAKKGRLSHDTGAPTLDVGYADVAESDVILNNKGRIQITDEEITAQGVVFFFAGFDSISSVMSFAIYEIAIDPEVQSKLCSEIDDVMEHCNGDITYEALLGMKYLDMVVSETLRKWPTMVASERSSVVPYTIEPKLPGEMPVHLEAGMPCCVPTYAIHRDPKYFPNPDKFDPERFNETNKKLIKPFTYLPFGVGPRNCIGARFALLEVKLIIVEILSKFEVTPIEKTQIPLKLHKVSNPLYPEKGIWLGLRNRNLLN